jgi:hypothetical protein
LADDLHRTIGRPRVWLEVGHLDDARFFATFDLDLGDDEALICHR